MITLPWGSCCTKGLGGEGETSFTDSYVKIRVNKVYIQENLRKFPFKVLTAGASSMIF
jgi:hypothetical protein